MIDKIYMPAVPAGNGSGAAIDISDLTLEKTVSVGGPFQGVVNIEVSCDGAHFVPFLTFETAGVKQLPFLCSHVRVSRQFVAGGAAPVVTVAAKRFNAPDPAISHTTVVPVPIINGAGAAVDNDGGNFHTVVVVSTTNGKLELQARVGAQWITVLTFYGVQSGVKFFSGVVDAWRCVRSQSTFIGGANMWVVSGDADTTVEPAKWNSVVTTAPLNANFWDSIVVDTSVNHAPINVGLPLITDADYGKRITLHKYNEGDAPASFDCGHGTINGLSGIGLWCSVLNSNDSLTVEATANGWVVVSRSDEMLPSSAFAAILDWWVDSAGGNDANDGKTAATALKTMAEVSRRIDGIVQPGSGSDTNAPNINVHVMNDHPVDDPLTRIPTCVGDQYAGTNLQVIGTPIQLRAPSVFTALDPTNTGTQTQLLVTDATLGDDGWAPYVGWQVRKLDVDGNVLSTAWILKDMGAKQARLSEPRSFGWTGAVVAWANGDRFDIVQLPTVTFRIQDGTSNVSIQNIAAHDEIVSFNRYIELIDCRFDYGIITNHCSLLNCLGYQYYGIYLNQGQYYAYNFSSVGGTNASTVYTSEAGAIEFLENLVLQSVTLTAAHRSSVRITCNCGVFDVPAAHAGAIIGLMGGANSAISLLWGANNGITAIEIRDPMVWMTIGALPTLVTTAVAKVKVMGVTYAYADAYAGINDEAHQCGTVPAAGAPVGGGIIVNGSNYLPQVIATDAGTLAQWLMNDEAASKIVRPPTQPVVIAAQKGGQNLTGGTGTYAFNFPGMPTGSALRTIDGSVRFNTGDGVFQSSNQLSISMWCKLPATPGNSRFLWKNGVLGTAVGAYIYTSCMYFNGGLFCVDFCDDNVAAWPGGIFGASVKSQLLPIGTPFLITGQVDAQNGGRVEIYLNGKLVAQSDRVAARPLQWRGGGAWIFGQLTGSNDCTAGGFCDFRIEQVMRSETYLQNQYRMGR